MLLLLLSLICRLFFKMLRRRTYGRPALKTFRESVTPLCHIWIKPTVMMVVAPTGWNRDYIILYFHYFSIQAKVYGATVNFPSEEILFLLH